MEFSSISTLQASWDRSQVAGRCVAVLLLKLCSVKQSKEKLQVKGHPIRLLMTGIDTSETLLQDQCVHAPLMQQRLVACWDTSPSNSEIMIEPKIYSF